MVRLRLPEERLGVARLEGERLRARLERIPPPVLLQPYRRNGRVAIRSPGAIRSMREQLAEQVGRLGELATLVELTSALPVPALVDAHLLCEVLR